MPIVSLEIDGETKEIEAKEGARIFDELEKQGISLPHGCLAGSCGSCRILIIEGVENVSAPSTIEKDTVNHMKQTYMEKYGEDYMKGKTLRLSCRAKVQGPIRITPCKDKF
jgi:ferredoxin